MKKEFLQDYKDKRKKKKQLVEKWEETGLLTGFSPKEREELAEHLNKMFEMIKESSDKNLIEYVLPCVTRIYKKKTPENIEYGRLYEMIRNDIDALKLCSAIQEEADLLNDIVSKYINEVY